MDLSSLTPISAPAHHRRLQALRVFCARLPDAILIADDDRRYVEANLAACRLLQKPRREILRLRVDDLSAPEVRPQVDEAWRQFLSNGTAGGEWSLANGSVRRVEFFARANFFPGLHLSSLRDLGPRKRREAQRARLSRKLERLLAAYVRRLERTNERLLAEMDRRRHAAAAMRQSERRYRALFRRASDAIMIWDGATWKLLEANERARALYGYRGDSMVGVRLDQLAVEPDVERRRYRAILRRAQPGTFEARRRRRDGTPITVEVSAAAVHHNGRPAILCIARDVTARNEASQHVRRSALHWRGALEASLNAIYVAEPVRNRRGRVMDFRFTDVNTHGLALIGAKRQDLIGGLVCELLPINRTAGFFDRYVRVLESSEPLQETFQLESPWSRARWKQPKWLFHRVVRLGDGIMISTRDVTEEKRAEAVLRALPQKLAQSQEEERQRIARELHDGVKQMLAGALLALRQSQGTGPRDEALREELVARAAEIVQQTLDEVRRISAGLRPAALESLGLRAGLAGLLGDLADRTGVHVQLRCCRTASAVPSATAVTLYRIAQEALANVERHARARRVTVRLAVRAGRAALTIADDGRGFALPASRRAAGNGLRHLRERAELAGGTCLIDASPGEGTRVQINLPFRK